jgi:hypothetical protein
MKRFRARELKIIYDMRASRISYRIIAERLGRSPGVIKYAVKKRPRPADERAAEIERLIEVFAGSGVSMTDLARSQGWSLERLMMRMLRAGFDAEMRRDSRAAA